MKTTVDNLPLLSFVQECEFNTVDVLIVARDVLQQLKCDSYTGRIDTSTIYYHTDTGTWKVANYCDPYAAPEAYMLSGKLWSLGCVLYELYARKPLFAEGTVDAHLQGIAESVSCEGNAFTVPDTVVVNPWLHGVNHVSCDVTDKNLCRVIEALLIIDPTQRYSVQYCLDLVQSELHSKEVIVASLSDFWSEI